MLNKAGLSYPSRSFADEIARYNFPNGMFTVLPRRLIPPFTRTQTTSAEKLPKRLWV